MTETTEMENANRSKPASAYPFALLASAAAAVFLPIHATLAPPVGSQVAVTIEQINPGSAGNPAGPSKPSGFRITFELPIGPASFALSDLSVSTSDAPGAGFQSFLAPMQGLVYTVGITASGDGTVRLTMPAGAVCSAGHYSGSLCDSGFESIAPDYVDNEIT